MEDPRIPCNCLRGLGAIAINSYALALNTSFYLALHVERVLFKAQRGLYQFDCIAEAGLNVPCLTRRSGFLSELNEVIK